MGSMDENISLEFHKDTEIWIDEWRIAPMPLQQSGVLLSLHATYLPNPMDSPIQPTCRKPALHLHLHRNNSNKLNRDTQITTGEVHLYIRAPEAVCSCSTSPKIKKTRKWEIVEYSPLHQTSLQPTIQMNLISLAEASVCRGKPKKGWSLLLPPSLASSSEEEAEVIAEQSWSAWEHFVGSRTASPVGCKGKRSRVSWFLSKVLSLLLSAVWRTVKSWWYPWGCAGYAKPVRQNVFVLSTKSVLCLLLTPQGRSTFGDCV